MSIKILNLSVHIPLKIIHIFLIVAEISIPHKISITYSISQPFAIRQVVRSVNSTQNI